MRRFTLWSGVLAMVVCAGNASALITPDGDWSDWFTYNGNVDFVDWQQGNYALTSQNIRSFADEEGPTPGGGGQLFDIEELFYVFVDDDENSLTGGKLYVGMVTGYLGDGVDPYYAGDLFLGLGGSGDLNIAVGVGTEAANAGRFGQAYFGDSGTWIEPMPGPFIENTPWRMDQTLAANITGLVSPQVAWGGLGVHNFLEVCLVLDGASEELITGTGGGLSVHWTMGCGNDVITVNDDDPFLPVPEPATYVLLGMGVLGIVLRSRNMLV